MTFSSDFPDLLAEPDITGLQSGRPRFLEALAADLDIASAQGERVAILLVDLRKFLGINLSFGYESGDEVLLQLPAMLRATIRKASAVERLGDNLFGLIIPALPSPALLPIAAEKIRQKLGQPLAVQGHQLTLECHFAAAFSPEEGQTSNQLLLAAERKLVDVKSRKFNDLAIPTLTQGMGRERWRIERELLGALEKGEFELYYQPKIQLRDRVPTSAEALIRWHSSEFGFVAPDEFIAVAEESSMINRITEWALKTAVRERQVFAEGPHPVSVAVNVSASDVYDRNLVLSLESMLSIWGVAPECLTLEVTESVIMDNPDMALRNLRAIRELGVRTSLDDFGTGYSSLAYFKALPVDEIKIDKSFVVNLRHDSDDAALVDAIINLAHKFNLTVVAEGVEDVETLKHLAAMSCDYAQGYYFSKPVPRDAFSEWLAAYRPQTFWNAPDAHSP